MERVLRSIKAYAKARTTCNSLFTCKLLTICVQPQTAADGKKVAKVVEQAASDLSLPWTSQQQAVYYCNERETMAKVTEVLWSIKSSRSSFPRRAIPRLYDGHLLGLLFPWFPSG